MGRGLNVAEQLELNFKWVSTEYESRESGGWPGGIVFI